MVHDADSALAKLRAAFPGIPAGLTGLSEGATLITEIAAGANPSFVVLMGLPTRAVDEDLGYQFIDWPISLASSKLDTNSDSVLSMEELSILRPTETFPLLGNSFSGLAWQEIDADKNGAVDLVTELLPAYQKQLGYLGGFIEAVLPDWYHSLQRLRPFPVRAKTIAAPTLVYHAMADAQASWKNMAVDARYLPNLRKLRFYPGLGHCFSPLEGTFGQIKTSGPFDPRVLSDLTADIDTLLQK